MYVAYCSAGTANTTDKKIGLGNPDFKSIYSIWKLWKLDIFKLKKGNVLLIKAWPPIM